MRSLFTIACLRLRDADLRPALLALILIVAGSVVVHGDEGVIAVRASGGMEAKLEYCKTCHGLSAQGYRGYFAMPRLAGQQPQYIENQLRAFAERRRTNPIMANVAHSLHPSMIAALASHFHHLDPRPIGGAPHRALALGKQLYEYTVGQLSGWTKQRGQGTAVDTSAIMAPTAHNLTRSQIEAVAAYVSTLQ